MRILITGSSGLIGKKLVSFLHQQGHDVMRLVRKRELLNSDEIGWDPTCGTCSSLEGFDAVVNLAGENIASGRWTPARKRAILESRLQATHLLCQSLAKLQHPPKVLVNASAIGYYGDQEDRIVNEESASGDNFLAKVCRAWEEATRPAEEKGIRVVLLRIGVVLSTEGGALAKMLPPFKLALGGTLGSGQQYMSWIALSDLIRVIVFVISHDSVKGPVNAVAPEPVTNRTFTKTLGEVLHRPTFFPVPAPILRFLLGDLADELLLNSTRVESSRLKAAGYAFVYPRLKQALEAIVQGKET